MSSDKQDPFQQVGSSDIDTNFDSNNLNTVYLYPISMLSTVKHNKI